MGLRVGAGSKDLTGPGENLTLAGLKEAAEMPTSNRAIKVRAPASASTAQNPTPANSGANVFDDMAGGNVFDGAGGTQGGGAPAPHPNGPPPESFAEKAKAAAMKVGEAALGITPIGAALPYAKGAAKYGLEHAEMGGAIAGGIGGEALAGPPGAVVGSGAGAAMGQKLERFVKGEPQPTGRESLMTAGQMAAMGVAGEYALNPAAKYVGSKIFEAARPVTEAMSPAMEAASQSVRDSAKDLLNYVGDKFQVFKHELMGDTPGAATMRSSFDNITQNGSEAAKQQVSMWMKQRQEAIFHNLSVLHDTLPKPSSSEAFDPKGFVTGWIDRHGQEVGNYKQQISDIIGDQKADVTGFLDGIGAHLRKNLVVDETGKILPSASKDQKYLANFYTDMMKLTKQPAPAKQGFDPIWDMITEQEWKGAVAESPVPTVSFSKEAAPGRKISMDDFNTLMRRIQKETVEQGGEMLPLISKDMTQRYYTMMADMAQKAGRPEVAEGLLKANQSYSQYIDFASDLSRQIEKNPNAAISVMVNKSNPEATGMMMRLLTPNQQKVMSRAFLSSAVQDAFDGSTGVISAKDVLKQIAGHGEKNLDIMFGEEKASIMGALNKLSTLQKTNLSYGAKENIVNDLAKDVARSTTAKGMWKTAIDWFTGKTADVADMLGSQEFADKVYRMESGMASRGQKAAQVVGKNLAPVAGKVPVVLGGAAGSMVDESRARRQMAEEENPFNR